MSRTPALDAWRRELAENKRTKYTFDALWRAACEDMNALEATSIPRLAAFYRREARRILADAAKQQGSSAA